MYKDVACLIEKVNTGEVDEYGDDIINEVETEIFVDVKSVTRSEFYTAQQAGYDPQIVFEMADYYDYDNQPLIKYEDVVYKIIRTYRTNVSLQLVCQHYDG